MNPIRQIAVYHFKKEVFKKSYILTLLSLPAFALMIFLFANFMTSKENKTVHVGVVDPGGFFRTRVLEDENPPAVLTFFNTQQEALSVLENEPEQVSAVYILPADYPANRAIDLFYREWPSSEVQNHISNLVRRNMLIGLDEKLIVRFIEGGVLTIDAIEFERTFPVSKPTADLFIPLMIAVIYMFTILPISGIMTGALGDEKVNRTMEVIITSVSPKQLITGKILAVSAIALIQIVFWTGLLAMFFWIGGTMFDTAWLQGVNIPWRDVTVIGLLAVPGFIFFGAALVLIGSLVDDAESLAQVGGMIFLPLFLPLYVLPILLEQPDSTTAVVFSLMPFTSVQTIGIQSIFMQVPLWRIASSLAISWVCAAGMIWLASQSFRIGMLRYGKRIRLKELLSRPAGS